MISDNSDISKPCGGILTYSFLCLIYAIYGIPVSCQRERSQKVDAEIPELGSSIESADSPLRRTAHCLSVREKKSRNGEALLSPSFLLSVYSFGIYIIARNFRSYSRGRVWAEPTKGNNHDALLIMQKNRK